MGEFFELLNSNVNYTGCVRELVQAIQRDPIAGIGKPEALKHDLKGYWSRRINQTDRLVYRFDTTSVFIFSLKGHYSR